MEQYDDLVSLLDLYSSVPIIVIVQFVLLFPNFFLPYTSTISSPDLYFFPS